jgi:hypothetical protein
MAKRLLYSPYFIVFDGIQNPDVSSGIDVSNATEVTAFVEYDANVTGGPVLLQSAPEQNYAGTWATEASSTGAASSTDRMTAKDGVLLWVRIDASGITGGKAKVWLNAWTEI